MESRKYLRVVLLLVFHHVLGRQVETSPSELIAEGDQEAQSYAREKCYGELGCFSTGGDFAGRPINLLPEARDKINTRFLLHTPGNLNTHDAIYLRAGDNGTLQNSPFDPKRITQMIIHGFLENAFKDWVKDTRRELLLRGDYNVIQVDWGGGSGFPYTQATANTRLVGAEVALLIEFLCAVAGSKPEDFHIIGHSLGSHTAGYAGERIANLGRITGMDPAGPYFENMPPSVRLDEEDALFVDILHTDGAHIINTVLTKGGFGLYQPIGHLDFYPNEGMNQPNCGKSPIGDVINDGITEAALQFVACSHLRVLDLLMESINVLCPYRAYPCSDWETFQEGKCLDCSGAACGTMGFHADRDYPLPMGLSNHRLYLVTGGEAQFCRYHYGISVTISERDANKQDGWLQVEVTGTGGTMTKKLTRKPESKNSFELVPGATYTALATEPFDAGTIISVRVWWECDSDWWNVFSYCSLRTTKLYLGFVEVMQGESQSRTRFCAHDAELNPKEKLTLTAESCS